MGLRKLGVEKISARPLEFIWILDVSGSMHGERIAALNYAIKEAVPAMQEAAQSNVNAEIMVRVLTFSTDFTWHISERTPVKDFEWSDVRAEGLSNLGLALTELASILDEEKMPERGLPPVLVLITDGEPTDDYKVGLDLIMSKVWGKKSVRLAISVGNDVEKTVLEDFIGNKDIEPFEVENASQLTQYIKFVSTKVLSSVSLVKSDAHSLFKFDFELPELDDESPNNDVYDKF